MKFFPIVFVLLCCSVRPFSQASTFSTRVNVWNYQLMVENYVWTDSSKAQLTRVVGEEQALTILTSSQEGRWPVGMRTQEKRSENLLILSDYKEYIVVDLPDSMSVIYVPAFENTTMPDDLKPTQDIYFILPTTAYDMDLSYMMDKILESLIFADFDEQMQAIVCDYENDFTNIKIETKGTETGESGNYFGCNIALESTVATFFFADEETIKPAFYAWFEGSPDDAIALVSYNELVQKMDSLFLTCCTLYKNEEFVSGKNRIQMYQAYNPNEALDAAYNGMILEINLQQLEDFDDNDEAILIWAPTMAIYKE